MNSEIKALVDILVSVEKVGVDIVQKQPLSKDVLDAQGLLISVPAAIQNWSQLKSDIDGLSDPAAQADLLAYVAGKFAGESEKAQKIIEKSVAFAIAAEQLFLAIKA